MKRILSCLAVSTLALLSACGSPDAPSDAPTDVTVKAGDTVAYVSWTAQDGMKYWVFRAEGTVLDYPNRSDQPGYRSYEYDTPPATLTGLTNGTPYAFLVAASVDGSAVGPTSASLTVTPRPAGAEWTAANALASGLNAVVYNDSVKLFVAVGNGGTVYTSPDAVNWTTRLTNTTADLNGVTFSNDRFVAVGNGGTILRSPDGVIWTLASSGTTANLNAVANYSGTAIAVGDGGQILISIESGDWTSVSSGTTQQLLGVGTNENLGRLVAVGAQGTMVVTDTSFRNWQPVASGTSASLRAVGSAKLPDGSNVFVVAGNAGSLLWSNDGLNFSAIGSPTNANLAGVSFGSQFAAIGDNGAVITSTDGLAWTAQNSGSSASLHGIAYALYGFIAVGDAGVNLRAL